MTSTKSYDFSTTTTTKTTPFYKGFNTDARNATCMRHSIKNEHAKNSFAGDGHTEESSAEDVNTVGPGQRDGSCDGEGANIPDAFDNKNRHNKNVVIWKDGYIVPLPCAAIQIEDEEFEEYFIPKDKCYNTGNRSDPIFSIGSDWSPEFENGKSVGEEDTDEQSRKFEFDINSVHHEKLEYESDDSIDAFLAKNLEDVGSRVTDGFVCERKDCECACTGVRGIKSCSECGESCEAPVVNKPSLSKHEQDEDGAISERSFYSTDSSDFSNGYEIVDWNAEWSKKDVQGKLSEAIEDYNTPPSSPKPESEIANGFHTAPNSPGQMCESFCVVDVPDDRSGGKTACEVKHKFSKEGQNNKEKNGILECGGVAVSKDGGQSNNAISGASNNMYALDTWEIPCVEANESKVKGIKTRTTRIQANFTRPRHSYSHNRRAHQTLETPPLIDVHAIQYEADPKTGKVLTVGKGSFGQVFKARFCDSRFHHLRIVVKEFDEEFTNKREIIEEAQRLLYLKDTGYVPICYGLVNMGTREDPTYGIVQEYIGTGLTLEQLLWDHYDMPLEMWLSIALQCCDGLDSFHKKGILLNDIKSNNIILEFYQDAVNIKYIDFGLATDMRGKRYKNTKSLEEFVYLAPEVRIYGNATTVTSDVYSLGYMLDQLNGLAAIPLLRFVAGLCLKQDPAERTLVRVAGDFIRNHMMRLGCDTSFNRDYGHIVSPECW